MSHATEQESSETGDYLGFDELVRRYFESEPRAVARVEFGAATHRGLVRPNNEDNFLVTRRRRERDVILTSLPENLLAQPEQEAYILAVADGMGGHQFGELASLMALRTGWDLGSGEVKWNVKLNPREADDLKAKAQVLFRLIDGELHRQAAERPELSGMGTTLTLCYTTGPGLFVVHAGDSRAYLRRDGHLRRLTTDHTRAQELIDAGLIEPGSPEARRYKHVLTNCLGGPYLSVDVDVEQHRLRDGDLLMLCTDGLTDVASDDEIDQMLSGSGTPQQLAEKLVDLALLRGGLDNVTVVVARYHFDQVPPTAELPTTATPPPPGGDG